MTTILERLTDRRVIDVYVSGQHVTIIEALDWYADIDLTPDEVDQLADELRAIAQQARTVPPLETRSEIALSPQGSGQAELSDAHSAVPSGIIEDRRTVMSKYTAEEVGRIYKIKKEPDPWGWIGLALLVLFLIGSCHHG